MGGVVVGLLRSHNQSAALSVGWELDSNGKGGCAPFNPFDFHFPPPAFFTASLKLLLLILMLMLMLDNN